MYENIRLITIKPNNHTSVLILPWSLEFQFGQYKITDLLKSSILIIQSSKSHKSELRTIDLIVVMQAEVVSPPFFSAKDMILLINF